MATRAAMFFIVTLPISSSFQSAATCMIDRNSVTFKIDLLKPVKALAGMKLSYFLSFFCKFRFATARGRHINVLTLGKQQQQHFSVGVCVACFLF